MRFRPKLFIPLAFAASLLAASQALALPSGTGEPPGAGAPWSGSTVYKPSEYRRAIRLIRKGQYGEAIPLLLRANEKSPGDPDILNELGFCYRQDGQMDLALQYYNQALDIDPDHAAAREYLGELYLMQRQLAMAQAQLNELKRICPAGCKARENLEKAIADYQTAGTQAP